MDLVTKWIKSNWLDASMVQALEDSDSAELNEMFTKVLDFGTGGMRGIIGPGPNRMNSLTVARAAAGFGDYLLDRYQKTQNQLVVIAYDNRHFSREFAMVSGEILAAKGFQVKVFQRLTATPVLSYAVRKFQAAGGIMITASHNPKEYNGFKIYDETGCQLLPQEVVKVKQKIAGYLDTFDIPRSTEQVAIIDDAIETDYVEAFEKFFDTASKEVSISYSPQHGTGGRVLKKVFAHYGFSNIQYVAEQYTEDPDFSHTKSPNPENPEAFEALLTYGQRYHSDLLLSTDPDADRLGGYCLNKGKYERLTGNQIGAILCSYLMEQTPDSELKNKYLVKTIVSSDLGAKIAQANNVETINVLTGFKYIGDKINQKGSEDFLFAYEESFGYLFNPIVRDKDGVQIALLIAEIADSLKSQGKTLIDYLEDIYQKYNYYFEDIISLSFAEANWQAETAALYTYLTQYFSKLASQIEDYGKCKVKNLITNQETTLALPQEKVFKCYLYDDSWLCIRPSGTEPKLKIYFGTNDANGKIAKLKLERLREEISTQVKIFTLKTQKAVKRAI